MLPLVSCGESLGTLGVASVKPYAYADTDVSFLREVATQVAMAVENMSAYARIGTLNATVTKAAERARPARDQQSDDLQPHSGRAVSCHRKGGPARRSVRAHGPLPA